MEKVRLRTIHEVIAAAGAKNVLAISSSFDIEHLREDGEKIDRRKYRNVESAFLAVLLENGIGNTPLSLGELLEKAPQFRKKGAFDLAVVMGDLTYRNLSIAAKLRGLKFKLPIYLEITKESASIPRDVSTTVATAKRLNTPESLRNLVYLTKVRPSPPSLDLDIDPLPTVELPKPKVTKKRPSVEPREFTQQASDLAEPPSRVRTEVTRIIRDTATARALKKLYGFRCQVCGVSIGFAPAPLYVEVHHVQPLGGEHHGTDTNDNMLVVCPNHHAMFDYGIPEFITPCLLRIGSESFTLTSKHLLSERCVEYHNDNLRRGYDVSNK